MKLRLGMAGYGARFRYTRNACRVYYDILKVRRPLWRFRHGKENCVKLYANESAWEGVDWIDLAESWNYRQGLVRELYGISKLADQLLAYRFEI